MDEFGLRRACLWVGNSPATAMKNYALVRKTDFVDDVNSVTKSDAILDGDAKSDAEPDSNEPQPIAQNPTKKALPIITTENSAYQVGDIGLEPTTSTMSTWRSSQLS